MDKLQTMAHETNKELKRLEKAIRAEDLKNMGSIEEMAELNARKFYYDTLIRKLQKVPAK